MTVVLVGPGDVDLYRVARLDALRADPDAFGSTLERELEFDDETWASRATGYAGRAGATFLDIDDRSADAAGVVGVGITDDPGDAELWGMWVRPTARGRGTGARLVEATRIWALGAQAETLSLWVTRGNLAAVRLYAGCGFGEVSADGRTPPPNCREPLVMRLSL